MPLVFEVSKNTMTPIRDIYDFPVTEFFYYSSFLVEQNQRQIKELEKIRTRNR